MLTGKILRFDEVRGYGFIAPDNGGEDVFVHANALADDKCVFAPGLPVEFEVAESERGLKALTVRALNPDLGPTRHSRRGEGTSARPVPARHHDDDDLCDVLSPASFSHELTELILDAAPSLSGTQIVQLRRGLVGLAQRHGWVER